MLANADLEVNASFNRLYGDRWDLRTYSSDACGYVFIEVNGFEGEERALTLDLRADSEVIPLQ
jgi:hypothetical protein